MKHGGEDAAARRRSVGQLSDTIVGVRAVLLEHDVLGAGSRDAERLPPFPRGGVPEPVPRLHSNRERLAGDGGDDPGSAHGVRRPDELRHARRRGRLTGEDDDVERRPRDGVALVPAPRVQRVPSRRLGLEANLAPAVARLHRLHRHGPDAGGLDAKREDVRPSLDGVSELVPAHDLDDAAASRGELREPGRVHDTTGHVRRARRARPLQRQPAPAGAGAEHQDVRTRLVHRVRRRVRAVALVQHAPARGLRPGRLHAERKAGAAGAQPVTPRVPRLHDETRALTRDATRGAGPGHHARGQVHVRRDDVHVRGGSHDGVAVDGRDEDVAANLRPANSRVEPGSVLGQAKRHVRRDAAGGEHAQTHGFRAGNLASGDVVIERLDVNDRLGARAGGLGDGALGEVSEVSARGKVVVARLRVDDAERHLVRGEDALGGDELRHRVGVLPAVHREVRAPRPRPGHRERQAVRSVAVIDDVGVDGPRGAEQPNHDLVAPLEARVAEGVVSDDGRLGRLADADALEGVASDDAARRVGPRGDHLQVPGESGDGSAGEGDAEGVAAASLGRAEESARRPIVRLFPEGHIRGTHRVHAELEIAKLRGVVVLVHRGDGHGRLAPGHAHEHAPGALLQPAQLHAASRRIRGRGRQRQSKRSSGEVVPRHAPPPLPLRLGGEHAKLVLAALGGAEPRNLPRGVGVGLVSDDLRLDHPGSLAVGDDDQRRRGGIVRAGAGRLDRVAEHVVAVDPDLQRRARGPSIDGRRFLHGARVGIQRARNAEDVKAVLVTRGLQRALVLSRALELVVKLVRPVAQILAPRVDREREAESFARAHLRRAGLASCVVVGVVELGAVSSSGFQRVHDAGYDGAAAADATAARVGGLEAERRLDAGDASFGAVAFEGRAGEVNDGPRGGSLPNLVRGDVRGGFVGDVGRERGHDLVRGVEGQGVEHRSRILGGDPAGRDDGAGAVGGKRRGHRRRSFLAHRGARLRRGEGVHLRHHRPEPLGRFSSAGISSGCLNRLHGFRRSLRVHRAGRSRRRGGLHANHHRRALLHRHLLQQRGADGWVGHAAGEISRGTRAELGQRRRRERGIERGERPRRGVRVVLRHRREKRRGRAPPRLSGCARTGLFVVGGEAHRVQLLRGCGAETRAVRARRLGRRLGRLSRAVRPEPRHEIRSLLRGHANDRQALTRQREVGEEPRDGVARSRDAAVRPRHGRVDHGGDVRGGAIGVSVRERRHRVGGEPVAGLRLLESLEQRSARFLRGDADENLDQTLLGEHLHSRRGGTGDHVVDGEDRPLGVQDADNVARILRRHGAEQRAELLGGHGLQDSLARLLGHLDDARDCLVHLHAAHGGGGDGGFHSLGGGDGGGHLHRSHHRSRRGGAHVRDGLRGNLGGHARQRSSRAFRRRLAGFEATAAERESLIRVGVRGCCCCCCCCCCC